MSDRGSHGVLDDSTTDETDSATATGTVTVVVADDRPVVRLGLATMADTEDGYDLQASCTVDQVVSEVEKHRPDVLVMAVRENDPDPFRVVASAKSLHPSLHVLVIADAASVIDLREAVIAGVDSFLLSSASEADVREAVGTTAQGERVVSPEVAMQLAGSWRADQEDSPTASLTPRELEVLQLLAEGLTNQEVGSRLSVSSRTIKTHVQNLLSKLDVPDRTGAVARGFRMGLIR